MSYPQTGGGLTELDQDKLDLWTVDTQNNVIATSYSVQSGLNSFKLGDMHTTHSGGENVFDQNNISLINWFPVWQGVKPFVANGQPMTINPSSRQYTAPFELLTNGVTPTANNLPYDLDVILQDNESVVMLEVKAGEAFAGRLRYQIKNGTTNGLVKYNQFADVDVQIGDSVSFAFTHPAESKSGDIIHVEIVKLDSEGVAGDYFLTKSGLDTSLPWLKLTLMGYEDVEVSAGVRYITASQPVLYSTIYAVDTSSGAVVLTPDRSTGLNSFTVFDADQNFNIAPCTVSFGGANGNAVLQTKNDSYLFYWAENTWRYLDLNTKSGGVV